MAEEEKININEMTEALQRSGYLLESRLIRTLSDFEYTIYPNEVYPDPITNKSRELDIFAVSKRVTENLKLDKRLLIDIQHEIILECSNNPQPAVFFKRPDKKQFTIFGRFKYNKIEQIPNEDDHGPDYEFNSFIVENKDFHYNKFNRCSQYCSFHLKKASSNNNKKEWFATHPEGLYDVFNKLYDFVNHKFQSNEEWLKTNFLKEEVHLNVFYPVIVLQGDLFEVIEENDKLNLSQVDNTIYEFVRFDDNSSTSMLIDIVTEKYFPEYLKLLESDMINLKNMYTQYYKGKTLKDNLPF